MDRPCWLKAYYYFAGNSNGVTNALQMHREMSVIGRLAKARVFFHHRVFGWKFWGFFDFLFFLHTCLTCSLSFLHLHNFILFITKTSTIHYFADILAKGGLFSHFFTVFSNAKFFFFFFFGFAKLKNNNVAKKGKTQITGVSLVCDWSHPPQNTTIKSHTHTRFCGLLNGLFWLLFLLGCFRGLHARQTENTQYRE